MSTRAKAILAVLTAVYLCCELAFNARLLDTVGSAANPDVVRDLEVWGRSLSGVAVALFVLQAAMYLRAWMASKPRLKMFTQGPGLAMYWCATLCACSGIASVVYNGLETLTETLVDARSAQFRHASMTAVLGKTSLLNGYLQLGYLPEQRTLFQQPEGKAFLALFPLLAVSMSQLEQEIGQDKKAQLRHVVAAEFGTPEAYYHNYEKAWNATYEQWKRYDGMNPERVRARLDGSIAAQQDRAWNDYLRRLGRHHWSPYTIPDRARGKVLRSVQASIPVPDDWDLADEEVFRSAVAKKARTAADAQVRKATQSGNRSGVPAGLRWEQFFAHPVVQNRLREQLHLPATVALKIRYASADEFERSVLAPAIDRVVEQKWKPYEAAPASLVDGGRFSDEGRAAARAVIVPPLALFCSLLGAMMHTAKLTYMLSSMALRGVPKASAYVIGAVLALLVASAVTLVFVDNTLTRTQAFRLLENKLVSGPQAGKWNWLLGKSLHAVAVGQGVFYPVDDAIRKQLLFDFRFERHAQTH